MGIGDRLREERERLGMSQADFAALAGAHRKSQGNYELSARAPDAIYLAAIATAGVDVLYVLTGQRSNVAAAQPLKPDEAALLDNYRNTSADKQGAIREIGAALAQSVRSKRSA